MKSDTHLDSLVFQLTPTRTRCDLVIAANGNMEKIASGLLEPFLAHLKTARDQIAKGGYSIILKPDPRSDMTWFTKGTVERFVRFVSTPEVLERVDTIESEMLQIDEAIAIQNNDNLGLSTVEDHQSKYSENIEGSKPASDAGSEKAIVLFKPGAQPPESNGSTTLEENSKVQLLRVLETRKTVLQKEQGMAFARAVAAGFDMEHLAYLLSFAEFFGASRLMEACIRFMELWKRKHETGQWLEIEATEAMSCRSDFSSMNASGIVISHGELGVDSNGKANNDASGNMNHQHLSSDPNSDKRPPMDAQVRSGPHQYFQGNFQHAMYPQWPIHSPSGAPLFQAYPMQGMPYYQNYQPGGPFFQPPHPPMENPRSNGAHRMGQKRHSMDGKDGNAESETWEMGVSNGRSHDGTDQSISEKEVSQGQEPQRKVSRSGKTKSGVVVIRNINYITSKRNNASASESETASESESDEEVESHSDALQKKHKNSVRSSKGKGSHSKSTGTWNSNERDDTSYGQEADSMNWQAFQNFLLRDVEEGTNIVDRGMFSSEKEAPVKRRQSMPGSDPILHRGDSGGVADHHTPEFNVGSGNATRTYKQRASSDELKISHEGLHSHGRKVLRDGHGDLQFMERGGKGGYRKGTHDDFILYGKGNQPVTNSHSNALACNEFGNAHNFDQSSSQNATDESFIVPLRSSLHDQVGSDRRTAIDIDSEVPTALQRTEDSSSRIRTRVNYEPDDLSLMPKRGTERESAGYDRAVDYEMEVRAEDGIIADNGNHKVVSTGIKDGLNKSDKEKKSRVQDAAQKRKMEAAVRRGKLSKSDPSAEARVRAERLRAFKADLQKMKREKEEEERKRLEALKQERQKRIAARGSSNPAHLRSPSKQIKSQLPTKLSLGSHKASRFSDSEPGSSSPLQRLPTKFASGGSSGPQKTTKPNRLNAVRVAGNGLSRSASSLTDLKKQDCSHELKAVSIRTRRLSDPKGSNGHHATLKFGARNTLSKPKLPVEPEIKKISAIMSLDRTKSATLPELKIKTSRSNSDIIQSNSAAKEIKQKNNVNRSSLTPESIKSKKSNEKTPHITSGDDNPVIEKTVVMLEHDVHAVPVVQTSAEKIKDKRGAHDDGSIQTATGVTEYAAIRAPASPVVISEVDTNPSQFQLGVHPSSIEVTKGNASHQILKSPSVIVSETPYKAPLARASSLEDPCTSNSEYSKAPAVSSEMETITESVMAHISGSVDINSLELIHGSLEKPRGKEYSKGFRRLLKFGRKNHSSAAGEHNIETDKSSIDGLVIDDHDATSDHPNEVHSLKNLLSQDDGPMGGTSHKVSRPFSLLSPFRSKSGEKKQTHNTAIIYKV
eukprot:TRINITY_DN1447_c0_g1_i11.p1 TRINITY_DN1447_c0_g1~~TRINITY_DN1447_c0_g1_i11.p1  ORF type:complete len:1347 (-),score=343.22 TRINITY_DN1447_c0_g1_i11:177-4217(-)